jgi:hypothetical protein
MVRFLESPLSLLKDRGEDFQDLLDDDLIPLFCRMNAVGLIQLRRSGDPL